MEHAPSTRTTRTARAIRLHRSRAKLVTALLLRAAVCGALGLPTIVSAQPVLVQSASDINQGAVFVNATLGSTPTEGNLLIAVAGNRDSSGSPLPQSAGWTAVLEESLNSPGQIIYYKIAGPSESAFVGFNSYDTATRLGIQIYEYSGVSELVTWSSKSGTGAAVSTTSVATTSADQLVLVGVVYNQSASDSPSFSSWGSSFVEQLDFTNGGTPSAKSAYGGADIISSGAGSYSTSVTAATSGQPWRANVVVFGPPVTAALTGSLAGGVNEYDIITGGETLIITLTGATWDATIGADNAKTTALIAGIDSAQAEGTGWDAVVTATLDFNDVVRTSDSVVTITLGAAGAYSITANETITVTIPATAVTSATEIVATPTFEITRFLIQQRAATSASATTGNLTVTAPAGTAVDDVLIASIGVRPNTTGITPPTGWTLVRRVDNTNTSANSLAVYRKTAGASEPADYTWTMSGAANSVGGIQAFSGVDTTSPIDVENGHTTASSVSHATPSVTTTVADAVLVTSHTYASGATWTPPAGITEAVDVQSGGETTTVESRVAAGSDDGEEDVSDGSVDLISSDLELINESESGEDQVVGMRFLSVTVPPGSTITNAYVEFVTDEVNTGATSLTIHAQDADNPGTFTSTTNNITNRTTTTASVAWNSVPAWNTLDETHQTPDLSAIIQEVVDRGGWASGNAMVVIVTGSGERTAKAYDLASATAPLLHVEYAADGQSAEAGYVLQATAGATGTKTATAALDADVGNTHILALTPTSFLDAALTGTLTGGVNEYDITTGGETLIITLTADMWDATIGADNAKTTALIDGVDSAQSETDGWDTVVKATLDFNDVVRTSNTVVTITLGAEPTYDITANETITVTVPATAVVGANAIVATPTFTITRLRPFDYTKRITIDRTKVGVSGTTASTLTNYPMLYAVTDVDLKSTGNGGHVTSTNGHDILFRAIDDATCGGSGPCTLDHEIERYDPVTGTLVAWVRVPSVKTNKETGDTVVHIRYGNSDITSSIQDADGVWDANYTGVWHLNETVTDEETSGTHIDSTTPAENGAQNGNVTATGQVASGQDHDGTDDYIQTTSNALKTANNFTISAWFKTTSTTLGSHLVWQGDIAGNGWAGGVDDCSANEDEMHLSLGQTDDANSLLDNRLSFYLGCTISTPGDNLNLGTAFTDTSGFNFVAVTVSSLSTSPAAELFLNGVSVATDTGTVAATPRAAWDTNLRFGRPGAAQRYLQGRVDEVRISTAVRDADWIKTVYNNTNGPGDIGAPDFYTVGTEDASLLTAVELVAFTATGYDRGVLLAWETGYEIDNLGFHVYRQQANERVQLTSSLIAGSGLLTQRGTAVTTAQAYAWWDMAVNQTTPGISYWLEDVDFDGTSTWHGPVTPVDGGRLIDVGPPAPGEGLAGPNSGSLDGLATVQGATRRAFLTSDVPPWTRRVATTEWGTPVEAQWALAQRPAVKIGVRRTGWFRVTQTALVDGGLDPNVDPRRLQLFVDGVEQAMTVTGEADGRFDPTDAVGFYGEGVDTAYTDLRVYWVVAGASRGRRIASATAPAATAVASRHTRAADAPARTAPEARKTPVTDAADAADTRKTKAAPRPTREAPARETAPRPAREAARPPAAVPPATPARAGPAPAAATAPTPTGDPDPVSTPGSDAAASPARAASAAAEVRRADAREAETTPVPVPEAPVREAASPLAPAAPSGDETPRATSRAPVFVVPPPVGTFPLTRDRRPASSGGTERPAPPNIDVPTPVAGADLPTPATDADVPTPAADDDAPPPFMRAAAARAIARQLELARAAGVPETALETLLADYDPNGSIDASLQIAMRLRTARLEALLAAATHTAPVEATDDTAPPPDARRSPGGAR